MELLDKITALLNEPLADMGYNLVRLRFGGEGKNRVLQIMAERLDEESLGVEDCAQISRTTSALLDVENYIDGAYKLEVSSPGIERPLVKREDYERFKGRAAKIELDELIDGQKRFKGTIMGLNDDQDILFHSDDHPAPMTLPFRAVYKAKLILTDEMIKTAQQNSRKQS